MARRHGGPTKRQLRRAGLKALKRLRRDAKGRWIERRTRPARRRS